MVSLLYKYTHHLFYTIMNRIFVTSDTWFNRPVGNLSEYTTNEYNDIIISNWNKVVGKKDIVYILGGLGIGDMYHLLIKLNGEIHILNNFYTKDELYFKDLLKQSVEKSVDSKVKNKIIFEPNQIIPIPQFDSILSYFPLSNWYGCMSGTFCFHGLTSESDLENNLITCMSDCWKNKPIEIIEVKNNISKFKKNV